MQDIGIHNYYFKISKLVKTYNFIGNESMSRGSNYYKLYLIIKLVTNISNRLSFRTIEYILKWMNTFVTNYAPFEQISLKNMFEWL